MAVAEFGIGARFKILNLEVQLLSATPTLKEVIMKNMSIFYMNVPGYFNLAESLTVNQVVGGSNPPLGAI